MVRVWLRILSSGLLLTAISSKSQEIIPETTHLHTEGRVVMLNGESFGDALVVKFRQPVVVPPMGSRLASSDAILTKFPSFKAIIDSLENIYGPVIFAKQIKNARFGDVHRVNRRTLESVVIEDLSQLFTIRFSRLVALDPVMKRLRGYDLVEYVHEPVTIAYYDEPNDPLFPSDGQWNLRNIQAPLAWNITHGSHQVRVGIVDEGTRQNHEDLTDKIVGGDGVEGEHGTWVAGVAAASTDNGMGVASIGWDLLLETYGTASWEPSFLVEKISLAADSCAVINMSWGTIKKVGRWEWEDMMENCPRPDKWPDSLYVNWDFPEIRSEVSNAIAQGVVCVAAAGNASKNPDGPNPDECDPLYPPTVSYPASYPDVIAVTGTQLIGGVETFRVGWNYGSFVWVTGPAVNITMPDMGGGYYTTSGTSFSCPLVAGLAGLMLSLDNLTVPQTKEILKTTADKIDTWPYDENGWNSRLGFGRINAHAALSKVILDMAGINRSSNPEALASNSQRKLVRELGGVLHQVFQSGGEILYRRSSDDGNTWHVTNRLSNGLAENSMPCLSFAGMTAVCIWSRPGDDDRLDLVCARSTDGGITWPAASTIESGFHGSDPGPIPSVSLYPDGSGIVLYRTAGSLRYKLTSNFGASWGSAATVLGSTASCNKPSSAINTTYWSAKQANIAYATDLPENSPRIHYNYYDFQAGSWGSATDLCSVLPGNYVHHANPSLAVSASEAYKTVHVAWDADDTYPATRVLVHREGGFRYFPSVYSVLHYQSESKPSISGLIGETAWMVYQSESGTSVWKRYYDGTYWAGGYGTWVANGRNPQISVGSSTAKYIWTEGSASPYEIKVSTEGLSKAGDMLAYSRALNVIDTASGASLSLEIGTPVLVYGDGRREEIPFAESLVDSFLTDIAGLLKMGQSSPFAVPSDAESLSVPIRISGIGQGTLLSDATGHITLNAVGSTSGLVLKVLTDAVVTESALRTEATLTVSVRDLADAAGNSPVQIQPEISGIRTGAGTIVSLGHMYRQAEGAGVAKGGEVVKQQGEIPARFLLHQNFPNPFNPSTRFSFDIAEGGHVSLTIHDVLGREVATVVEGHREPGRYTVEWNAGSGATTLSSGVYLARLQVKSAMGRMLYSQTAKIIAIK